MKINFVTKNRRKSHNTRQLENAKEGQAKETPINLYLFSEIIEMGIVIMTSTTFISIYRIIDQYHAHVRQFLCVFFFYMSLDHLTNNF